MGKAFKSYWKFVQSLFVFFYAFRKKNILKWDNLGKNTFLNRFLALSVKEDFEKERIKIFQKQQQNCWIGRTAQTFCFY